MSTEHPRGSWHVSLLVHAPVTYLSHLALRHIVGILETGGDQHSRAWESLDSSSALSASEALWAPLLAVAQRLNIPSSPTVPRQQSS